MSKLRLEVIDDAPCPDRGPVRPGAAAEAHSGTVRLSPPHLARLLGPREPTAADCNQDDADRAARLAARAAAADFAGTTPEGARCYICLEGGAGLVRGCACRGTAGYAHVGCLAAHARSAPTFARWQACGLCKNAYQGATAMALATAAWATYVQEPETNDKRLSAQVELSGQLLAAQRFAEARPRLEACLQTCARVGDDARALVVTANLALSYHLEGRADDALQLTRTVFREQRRLRGPRHPEALLAASNLAGLLLSRGDAAAALGLLREARRNAAGLARDSDVRLRLTYNIAHALCATGNHGEAEALAEENLVLQNRVYGTAHPNAAAALELVGHVRAGLAAQA